MPRKPIGETAMTDAERQARYRAARATGAPVIRVRRAVDYRGRARRWTDNVAREALRSVGYRSLRTGKGCHSGAVYASKTHRS
jgi:hypothetical protein